LENKRCHGYQINGVTDHLHILCGLRPAVSLASLIKDVKVASSQFIKEQDLFPEFTHWQDGYGAFTCSYRDKDTIIRYIQGQEEHHRTVTFMEEFTNMLNTAGVEYDPKYLV